MYCSAADSDARRGDDDRVVHRAVLLELAHHVLDRRRLLADRDVDADEVLALLVDDRVDRDRGLAGLAVADDQLALAAADRHHRVDRLQAGLHRLRHRLALDHAGRDLLDDVAHLRVDRALAVDRLAERVDDAADQLRADRHVEDAARALDGVAFGDVLVGAQDHRADRVALEVQREAERVVRELEHLALHRVGQAVDAADAVGDRHHRALRAHFRAPVSRFWILLLISSLISDGFNCMVSSLSPRRTRPFRRPRSNGVRRLGARPAAARAIARSCSAPSRRSRCRRR